MLFAPNEKGNSCVEYALILFIVAAAYLILARVFCWWPLNNAACRATPF